jgi:metal transporter CNNM
MNKKGNQVLIFIGIIIILLLVSAMFSGLTIGMFSLNLGDLERKIKEGNKDAEKIYEIRKDGNLLLCTLTLSNTVINSTIAVLMAGISTGAWAAALSSVFIFLFAEVLPQALFSRHAFLIVSKTVWLVKIFRVLMYVAAKPIALLLDFIFGKEYAQRMSKREVELLLHDHVESIDSDEKRIMVGAMKFSDKKAVEIMTPVTKLFRYEAKTVLTKEVLAEIKEEHYSRIPIYSETRDNIIGILYAKDLIGYEVSTDKTVAEMCKKDDLTFVEENIKLDLLMNHMIQKRVHLAFVFDQFHSLSGVVSLEDIMEEILTVEIMDETDTDADLQHKAKNSNTKIFLQ